MDHTRQESGSNAHSVTGTPTIQQTSRGTQTGAAITTQVTSTAQVANITQVAITAQLESFELFGELPPELKTKILNIAAREVPRVVEMTPQGNHRGYTPALLGVSRMVRKEALKVYNTLRPGSPQPVYFNPDNDTFILNIAVTLSTVLPIAPLVLTPITLPPPTSISFSLGPPTLDRFTVVVILDPSDGPDFQERMASIGVKSFVVRLGY
ncbi:uncharacterized protein EAF01_005847 [Botrytis porri]|uniref:2EXR domain-containing protein n=1 Tax=Botrytis porri TaxID=87229 RepID=A0A4Z1L5B5_9HELO|nr:uncharacterized protein EAF01_005847 [Botrytis porri]KAF7905326.1 hypothetical protein EAF01_005847 [Botrytis porri]TGO91846.1 hypothetical protein BPOR_0017g00280 [Botrytis porri]